MGGPSSRVRLNRCRTTPWPSITIGDGGGQEQRALGNPKLGASALPRSTSSGGRATGGAQRSGHGCAFVAAHAHTWAPRCLECWWLSRKAQLRCAAGGVLTWIEKNHQGLAREWSLRRSDTVLIALRQFQGSRSPTWMAYGHADPQTLWIQPRKFAAHGPLPSWDHGVVMALAMESRNSGNGQSLWQQTICSGWRTRRQRHVVGRLPLAC